MTPHPDGLLEVTTGEPRHRPPRAPPPGSRATPRAHPGTVEWRGDEVVLPDPFLDDGLEFAGPPTLRRGHRRGGSPL